MPQFKNVNINEEADLKKFWELFLRNYKLFIISIILAVGTAFLYNHFTIPVFNISSSILIKENEIQRGGNSADFLNSNLFGSNQNFQNELWVLKSSPTVEQAARNLDLTVSYYRKEGFQYREAYQEVPFQVSYLTNHPQPIGTRFKITFLNEGYFQLNAESKKDIAFFNFETNKISHQKDKWIFEKNCKIGDLIETSDLAFIVRLDSTKRNLIKEGASYGFTFRTIGSISGSIKSRLTFKVVDRMATVIEINLKHESVRKGIDVVNELMNVYSAQNLDRKNHIASITIDYIEKQLNEISDSLSLAEDNLQNFRSSNLLLNITDQATGISTKYIDLQNQLAGLVSQKRYYDYVSDLLQSGNFSNMMLPASMGIQDQLLNSLMSELITAQAQRSNLIENKQERNPRVQQLGIQIENVKKTISENIAAVAKTTAISIDEMNKQIRKIEGEISRLPVTQRQLGNIERKYRLNDAIYNYMLEKRAEAKITKASNLPDNVVIETARKVGSVPISPNTRLNYMIAFFLGLGLPFSYLILKSALNNKIETQDDIPRFTDKPALGVILHNRHKTNNVMFEFPKSNIAESFRALRTNLDFYVRGGHKKVIMITSCLEHEGKSFIALNLAMSYAQLGRKTILLDFDLRKSKTYFKELDESREGLSSYLINKANLENIVNKSPHDKLDYVLSGIMPPNPVELLALEKTETLLKELKDYYDIIVLDTPPLAQVTDAYLLIDHTDLKIIITRCNFTFKRVFSLVMKDLDLKNVANICVVLNDNRIYSDQYGYGYGYYNDKRKKWKMSKK